MHRTVMVPNASTQAGIRAAFILLIIGLVSAGVTGCIQATPIPQSGVEYVGRVTDALTQKSITGAKVTLDLDGMPLVVYTDSEGVYQFVIKIDPTSSGQLRVEAIGYQAYILNVIFHSSAKYVQDIRLNPLNPATPFTPMTPVVIPTDTETPAPTFIPIPTSSFTPSPTLTSTSVDVLSQEIRMMDQYYRYINNVSKKDDLQIAWDSLTRAYRCRLYPNCKPADFLEFWWIRKVHYKLYDCDPLIVEVELVYYYRDPEREIAPAPPQYVKYFLVNDKGSFKIDGGEDIPEPEAGCRQVVSSQ